MTFKMKNIHNVIHGLKPTILMVIAETILGVSNVLFKLASNDGSDLRILVAYRFLFAAAFMVPVALFVERNKRPKLTWKVIWQSFLSALVGGSLLQNLFVLSLALTSATFTTATTNLVTAITFILAICFRLEKLNWDKASGKAKVMGTLLSLAGAMVLTLYKGPDLINWNTHLDLGNHGHHHGRQMGTHPNMILGACSALGSITCYALWMILQAKIAEHYPCPYSSTALMVTMTSIQCTLYCLCVQRDWSQWKLGWNIRLLTAAYSGVMATGVMFTLFAWCVRMRGPLFVSAFNPLMVVIVALAGPLVLNETLHLGSMLGGIYTLY
ncbi:Nodulin MtN21 /EamA-like transporter family protein [Heracleum sosnowskyi]|uniref:WAT1-related protein n=1 Tax=Heracleum sosnowskyi TaxID=360622 RepID=A0AAD8NAU2_9APIA|nr:Nodulin MtN21 /EamA-like transporter family protein [Heracleum sosnowskyi]